MKLIINIIVICIALQLSTLFDYVNSAPFMQGDESRYLSSFNEIIKDSYSEQLPTGLVNQCKNKGNIASMPEKYTSGSMKSNDAQHFCTSTSKCIIPAGSVLTMNSNLDVGVLIVKGSLIWNDFTQTNTEQWLCAGYISIEDNGVFEMNVRNKKSFIYIKNNGASHSKMGERVFGGISSGPNSNPRIDVSGREMKRTWSLLAKKASPGDNSIQLMHSPQSMGWQVGDRIVIAPTDNFSKGTAQSFTIRGISANSLHLSSNINQEFRAEQRWTYAAESVALLSAEVINLSRNIVITGDDFTHRQCEGNKQCTFGLHTIMMYGGVQRIQYTRIEKCGQRGVLARYCMHYHLMNKCENCLFKGNAVEFSQQRGIVVHGTHLTTVRDNVLNDVRGAGLYVEDGNEMYNNLLYNVVICPWPFEGPKGGCTVAGTDNDQADTGLNQSGFWGVSQTQNLIGNRFSNSFNGMLYETAQTAGRGRGAADGKVCPQNALLGHLEGNTFHGHGRFGTYFLGNDFPKITDQSVNTNGYISNFDSCKGFNPSTGLETGISLKITNNVDYGNVFVGQYDAGDIQYAKHTSFDNLNLIYWKTTKNFNDGCSSHIKDGIFSNGNMALPDQGSIIIENTRFEGRVTMESNHHCNEGVTGVLCSPVYIFLNTTWLVNSGRFTFHGGANNFGGMFTLAPPDEKNVKGEIFPAGYCSLASHFFSYLLPIDSGSTCKRARDISDELRDRYSDGILCKRPLRALKIYTDDNQNGRKLKVELWQRGSMISSFLMPFHSTGGTRKKGYALPVIPGTDHEYRLSLEGGNIPKEWIIEFSDPVIGNRWRPDELKLVVAGRSCPSIVTSQHDRRFIYADPDNHLTSKSWGHGACSTYPDMPAVNCAIQPEIEALHCDNYCPQGCNNGYCDCGQKKCVCKPGFSGLSCEKDICSDANCGKHGRCTARYLGGDLPVTIGQCMCEPPFTGVNCDKDPCNGRTCNGNGVCVGKGDNDWQCICDPMFSGRECQKSCKDFGCSNQFNDHIMFGCAGYDFKPKKRHYCRRGGGCAYPDMKDKPLSDEWCCYRNCDDNEETLPQIQTTTTTFKPVINTVKPITTNNINLCVGKTCSGHGKCISNNGQWKCECEAKYTGKECEKTCLGFGCSSHTSHFVEFGCAFQDFNPTKRHYCQRGGGCAYLDLNEPPMGSNWCCFKNCHE
jgi:hypothetical protein